MAEPVISFGNIIALYGTYFLAQSYGYAHGKKHNATIEVKEAILFGAQHLYHIAKPTGPVAWPLTPFLCAGLLLFVIYSPSVDGPAWLINHAYAAIIFTSVMGIGAVACGFGKTGRIRNTYQFLTRIPGCFQISYLACYIIMVCAGGWLLDYFGAAQSLHRSPEIIREMVSHGMIGWLFFVAYVGSRFDGEMDLARGCSLEVKRPSD